MKANFGLGIATGTEGLMYPIPYSSARDVVDLSVYAEKLGFHSVWGNDHITTQNYVREEFANNILLLAGNRTGWCLRCV